MLHLSDSEKKSSTERQLKQILVAVSQLTSKSSELESKLTGLIDENGELTQTTYQEILEMIQSINDEIAVINARNRIYGADIYIQSTEPTTAKENDCWLDLSILK